MDTQQNDKVQHAFPRVIDDGTRVHVFPGMTLRDYLAAAALPAIMARGASRLTPDAYSKEAYRQADAMLAAREGK